MSTSNSERPLVPAVDGAQTETSPSSTAMDAAFRLLPGPGGNPALDRLASLAARLMSCPSAQVSLLTDTQVVAGTFAFTVKR